MSEVKIAKRKDGESRAAKWRHKNIDKSREWANKYYEDNKEKLLEYQREYRKENPRYGKTGYGSGYAKTDEGWAKYKTSHLRTQAKRKGLEFDLDWKYMLSIKPDKCPVTGVDLNYDGTGVDRQRKYLPSIDRIDNTKGYIKGNIEIVSHQVNCMKSNLSIEEVVSYTACLLEYYKGKLEDEK